MKKKFLAIALSLVLCLSLAACGNQTEQQGEAPPPEEDATEETEQASEGLKDGTYESEQVGMNDKIKVEVAIADGKIDSVKVLENSDTPGVGKVLVDKDGNPTQSLGKTPDVRLPEEIVEYQTLNLDTVTGATMTHEAIIAAVEDCITQAGGNPEDYQEKPEYSAEKIEDTDVLILGGGGTGLAAAITAAQAGKDVTVVEKLASCGGDTLVCGAIYNCPDEELQKEVEMTDPVKETLEEALEEEPDGPVHKELQDAVREQWEEYKESGRTDLFDSNEWYALQTWNGGDRVADPDLVKKLTFDSYDKFRWIVDSLGMEFSDKIAQGAGSLWQRTHTSTMPMGTGFISVYANQVEELSDKIHICVESTAKEMIQEDDRVVGAVIENNRSGESYEIHANDGVILTTGGFSANAEMVQENNTSGKWSDLSEVPTTNREQCSQGDGIKMAEDVGASFTDMDQIQLLFLGNIQDGQLTKYPPRDVNGMDQVIFVNEEGNRFVREDGRRDEICLAVLEQPESIFYILESADGEGYVPLDDPDWRSADGFTLDYLKEKGFVFIGEDLDEIAEQIGCDAETLKETVAKFNESVESGEDEFDRQLYATKLENGPWVATPRQACIHHTMGGVTIDTEGHVMDKENQPIPGLYAGGEITGGVHGSNRLGGNAVVDTVVFGSTAAETLVSDSE